MIKQWMAVRKITFSILVFSLTMGSFSFAQEMEEEGSFDAPPALEAEEQVNEAPVTPVMMERESTRTNIQGGSAASAGASSLSTQPVVVTSSMSPAQVPQAMPSHTYANQHRIVQPQYVAPQQAAPQGGMVVTAPGTGIGGSNPGNANTGGVQVQSVTVQANPSADSVSAANDNVADILRRHRIKNEVDNENRLIERLEMGRLEDERIRAQSIDGFHSSVGNNATAVNGSQSASAQTSGNDSPATAIAAGQGSTVTVQQVTPVDGEMTTVPVVGAGTLRHSYRNNRDESRFSLAPFIGRRWFTSSNQYFDVQNQYVTGLTLDGAINEMLGIEGSFSYSRDQIEDISGIGGSYGYAPGGSYYYGAPTRERDNFEVGIGLKVGSQFGRIRPYALLGLGARQSRYEIDDPYTTQLAEQAGWQRSTNKMLGLMGLGLDVGLSRNMSLGGRFDYQAVLNKKADYMDMLYDDSSNSYQGAATLKVSF